MKQKIRIGVLGALLTCSASALADGQIFLSVSSGKFDHDQTLVTITDFGEKPETPPAEPIKPVVTSFTLDNEESDLISVSWGVADDNARFVFEYYYQNTDLVGLSAEYTKHAIFYSGYWTPNLYLPRLHGILGAGIGGAELTLDSEESLVDDFKDREIQYKLTAGLEYRLNNTIAIFGTYEQHYTRKYSHWSERRQVDVKDGDQTLLQIGLTARF
jgi:hypothetical protein